MTQTARMTANEVGSQAPDPGSRAVLVVDDDASTRRGLGRLLTRAGHRVLEAASVASARRTLDAEDIQVVVLDIGLPDEDGLALLAHATIQARSVAAIVFTASRERGDMKRALSGGATSYLVKSEDALSIEAQVECALDKLQSERESRREREGIERRLKKAMLRWDALPRDIAMRLCGAWDLRHIETGGHVRRISLYTEAIAAALGQSPTNACDLGEIAVLHDIGKLAIPDVILSKPGPLTDAEFSIMKQHTLEGARMLSGIQHPFFERAADVALRHHERWDGRGYPHGLVGEQCPEDARIVAVADVYDALATSRCYKPAWEEARVVSFFQGASGSHFEPRLVEALLDTLPCLRALAQQVSETDGDSDVFRRVARMGATVATNAE